MPFETSSVRISRASFIAVCRVPAAVSHYTSRFLLYRIDDSMVPFVGHGSMLEWGNNKLEGSGTLAVDSARACRLCS